MNNKKRKRRTRLLTIGCISRLTAVFLGGSYVLSGFSYGFKTINKTIKCDIDSKLYNMDYLTSEMESRDINDLRIDEMSMIDTLKVDMASSKSLNFLSYYVSLKSIEISNAQLLTDEDIKAINYSNINEIYLFFDRDATINNLKEGFDLDRFKDKSYIKNVDFIHKKCKKGGYVTNSKETDSIIFFEYLKNYEDCNLDFMKYSNLNDEINYIVNIVDDGDEYNNQMEYLFSTVDYICDHFEYDDDIKSSNSKNIFKKKKINQKIDDYNKYSLSSALTKDISRVTPAICTNYAEALTTLCIKKGINIHTVSGDVYGTGHAWNIINFGGYYYLIDLTNYEKLNTTFNFIREYRNNPTQENYEAVLNNLLVMINDESLDYYNSTFNILDYVEPKPVKNSTDNIYGTNDNKYEVAIRKGEMALVAYFLLCIGGVSLEVIKEKRKYKKNKGTIKKSLDRFSK